MSFRKQWLFWIDLQVAFQNRRRLALRFQAHPEEVSVEPRTGRIPNERDLTRGVGAKNVLARPKINKYHGTSYLRMKLISCPAAGSAYDWFKMSNVWFSCEPFPST